MDKGQNLCFVSFNFAFWIGVAGFDLNLMIRQWNNLAMFPRRMANGGMVARLLTGRVRLQRGAARSLLGNFHGICLKMNWCHCVRRWDTSGLIKFHKHASFPFLNPTAPLASLGRSTRWEWWWTSMETTEATPLSPSAPNRKPKQLWSSSTTTRSGPFWRFWPAACASHTNTVQETVQESFLNIQ